MIASKYPIYYKLCLLLLAIYTFFLYLTAETVALLPHTINLLIDGSLLSLTFVIVFVSKIKYDYSFPLYFFVLAIIGFMYGKSTSVGRVDVDSISDLLICCLAVIGISLIKINENFLKDLIRIIIIPGILISIYEFSRFDFGTIATLIVDRSSLWQTRLFFCTTFFWYVHYLTIYAFVFKKYYMWACIVWILCMFINLVATKRTFIVETVWVLSLVLFFYYKTKQLKNTKYILLGISVVGFAIVYYIANSDLGLDTLFEAQSQRLSSDGMEDNGFSRIIESQTYFSKSNIFDYLFGKGLGVAHHGLGGPNTALHLGFTNLVLKFGVFLIIPYIIMLLRIVRNAFLIGKIYVSNPWRAFCILCALSAVPNFFMLSNYWARNPMITFFWFFLVMASYKTNQKNYAR